MAQGEDAAGAGIPARRSKRCSGRATPPRARRAYAEADGEASRPRNPADDEAQTFYALALLAHDAASAMPSLPIRQQAGAIAETVFARNPKHPGRRALHPARLRSRRPSRREALAAARAYAKIAPAASHALHMPAHAFVQLGLWDEAAATTRRRGTRRSRGQRGEAVGRDSRFSQPDVAAVRMDAAGPVHEGEGRAGIRGRGDESREARRPARPAAITTATARSAAAAVRRRCATTRARCARATSSRASAGAR